jgi:hypothetical protein
MSSPTPSYSLLLPPPPQTLSWLKENVGLATQVCSVVGQDGLEAARRCQEALEKEILSNGTRIEVVKRVSTEPHTFTIRFSLKTKCFIEYFRNDSFWTCTTHITLIRISNLIKFS